MAKKKKGDQLISGTLNMMILSTLAGQELHGAGILQQIETQTGTFDVEEGSLYPALHRLERQGWISGSWRTSDAGRRAKFYQLTASGKRQLKKEIELWRRGSAAIEKLLKWE